MAINPIQLTINTVPKPIGFYVDYATGNVEVRYDVNTDDGRPERQGLNVPIAFSQLSGAEQNVVANQIKPFCDAKVNADWANRVATKT